MNYVRVIAERPDGERLFIKHHDDARFTDALRAHHSKQYLAKEFAMYQRLAGLGYPSIPQRVRFDDGRTLSMESLEHHAGWHWRAPADNTLQPAYIRDILAALSELSHQPIHDLPSFLPDINYSHPTLLCEGWERYLDHQDAIHQVLLASTQAGSRNLLEDLPRLFDAYHTVEQPELSAFSHHDLRQSNIAWHPTEGVRIVDWSWADAGMPLADTTSFLIDLAKSGIDITPYRNYFDPAHALLLIGFWLEHSTWPTQTDDRRVREHQLTSALAAHRILMQYGATSSDDVASNLLLPAQPR